MLQRPPTRHKVAWEHFLETIDSVRFLIRRFPLYTYSMAHTYSALGALFMNLAIILKQALASISTLWQFNHPLPFA